MKEEVSEGKECIKWSEDKLGYILMVYRACLIILIIPVALIDFILFCLIQYILKDWYYVAYYGLVTSSISLPIIGTIFTVWLILEMANFAKKKDYMRVCSVSVFLCVILSVICWLEINKEGGISSSIGAVKDFKYVYNNSYTEEVQTFIGVDESKTRTNRSTSTSYDIVTKEMRFDLSCYADDKEFAKKFMCLDMHGKKIRVRYLPNSQLLLEAEIID